MSKKIAIINDLSGLGRCSLTAAISVTSAMGVQACPLPTAILSAQTGYPHYKCYDFTHQMVEIRKEWELLNRRFDGIYTGFVSNEAQIDNILDFVKTFHKDETFLLVDPVMGDDGWTYDMFTPELKDKMKILANLADVITPNLTEFCLLTDTDYNSLAAETNTDKLLSTIRDIATAYYQTGPKHIVITGIHYLDHTGIAYMGNSYISANEYYHTSCPKLGGSYSGTGDLFASCLAAGIANNMAIPQIMDLSNTFLAHAIQDSVDENVPYIEGVNFEKHLHLLRIKK